MVSRRTPVSVFGVSKGSDLSAAACLSLLHRRLDLEWAAGMGPLCDGGACCWTQDLQPIHHSYRLCVSLEALHHNTACAVTTLRSLQMLLCVVLCMTCRSVHDVAGCRPLSQLNTTTTSRIKDISNVMPPELPKRQGTVPHHRTRSSSWSEPDVRIHSCVVQFRLNHHNVAVLAGGSWAAGERRWACRRESGGGEVCDCISCTLLCDAWSTL